MLIKKLILHNFRQYIDTQEIAFSTDPDRNVTVLIGVNTSGKPHWCVLLNGFFITRTILTTRTF